MNFSGGLVPGVDVYGYMTHQPVARWGRAWLERGIGECRLLKPVYDGEIAFVDASIGRMVSALDTHGLRGSTLIIITAKHGQSPIDPARYVAQLNVGSSPATVLGQANCIPYSESPLNPTGVGPTEDDISLIWLSPSCSTADAVDCDTAIMASLFSAACRAWSVKRARNSGDEYSPVITNRS